MNLGFNVYFLGETITPAAGKDDLVIAISGTGMTKLVVSAASAAKDIGAKVVAITSYKESQLGQMRIPAPVHFIDAEMTSWYGSRAIRGLAYLRELRKALSAHPA